MEKLISFDLKATFGFFRKPDVNYGLSLSYNMLHKPSLLGLLGAIVGLEGFDELGKLPIYYKELKHLKVGIRPLGDSNGSFNKTIVKYSNTVGYANKGSNFLAEEQMLIQPSFRCYLLLNIDNTIENNLYTNIKTCNSIFIPYLGKNEFSAWWEKDDVKEYVIEKFEFQHDFTVESLIHLDQEKENTLKEAITKAVMGGRKDKRISPFLYFEALPISLTESDSSLEKNKKSKISYGKLQKFVFTNADFTQDNILDLDLYSLGSKKTIHLF